MQSPNFRSYTNFCIDEVYNDICGYIWLPEQFFVYSGMENKLRLLAKMLQDADSYSDMYDGVLESRIKTAQVETMQRIGDYLEEILDTSDDIVNTQLDYDPRTEKYEI